MKYISGVFAFLTLLSANVFARESFDASSYEIMQNCLAEAESLPNSADYVKYCTDSYLSTQQIGVNERH